MGILCASIKAKGGGVFMRGILSLIVDDESGIDILNSCDDDCDSCDDSCDSSTCDCDDGDECMCDCEDY